MILGSISSRIQILQLAASIALPILGCTSGHQKPPVNMVRLAKIIVDSTQTESYNTLLKEEIEASIKNEPGVLTLYAVSESERPHHVTLFETYADSSQYKAHLATPHFRKYKTGTKEIVQHLELIETSPILYVRKNAISHANPDSLFIRLIEIVIDSTQIENFNRLASDVMLPGIRNEEGLLVMYAVAKQDKPTEVNILEVYADAKAYETHRMTSHFIRYKEASALMVKSLKLIAVKPISLGSKQR